MRNLFPTAVIVVGILGSLLFQKRQPEHVGGSREAVPELFAEKVATQLPSPRTLRPYPSPSSPNLSVSAMEGPAVGQRVEQLSHSTDPRDRYRAYKLVRACVDASLERKEFSCGGMSPGQLSAHTRYVLVSAAADAGVWGAVGDRETEGPDGQAEWYASNSESGQGRAMEKQLLPRVQQQWTAAASSGDPYVLLRLISSYLDMRDFETAVALAVARQQVVRDKLGNQGEFEAERTAAFVKPYRDRLSAEKTSNAVARGLEMFAAIKSSPFYGSN